MATQISLSVVQFVASALARSCGRLDPPGHTGHISFPDGAPTYRILFGRDPISHIDVVTHAMDDASLARVLREPSPISSAWPEKSLLDAMRPGMDNRGAAMPRLRASHEEPKLPQQALCWARSRVIRFIGTTTT